jgi:hypothetical protein
MGGRQLHVRGHKSSTREARDGRPQIENTLYLSPRRSESQFSCRASHAPQDTDVTVQD